MKLRKNLFLIRSEGSIQFETELWISYLRSDQQTKRWNTNSRWHLRIPPPQDACSQSSSSNGDTTKERYEERERERTGVTSPPFRSREPRYSEKRPVQSLEGRLQVGNIVIIRGAKWRIWPTVVAKSRRAVNGYGGRWISIGRSIPSRSLGAVRPAGDTGKRIPLLAKSNGGR